MNGAPTLSNLVKLATCAIIVACAGKSNSTSTPAAQVLSGTVFDQTGTGVPGVVINVSDASATRTARARTNSRGNFIVIPPAAGKVTLDIDPEAVHPSAGRFPSLHFTETIGTGAATLSKPIVLHDLTEAGTATVQVDGSGRTSGHIRVAAPDGSAIDIPDQTALTVGQVSPSYPIDIFVTGIPPESLPIGLPTSLNVTGLMAVHPQNAAFSPRVGVMIPNNQELPYGTLVDIWSFSHDIGTWINSSSKTGNQGVVADVMGHSVIMAPNVLAEGGWHAAALPVEAGCATTIRGIVQAEGTTNPVENASICLGTGQSVKTNANGEFTIPLVPAYVTSDTHHCTASGVRIVVTGPVGHGAARRTAVIMPGTITPGGQTDVGRIELPVSIVGSVAGTVAHDDARDGAISLSGPENVTVGSSCGAFFATDLTPGTYVATLDLNPGTHQEPFIVTAGTTSLVSLAPSPPTNDNDEFIIEVFSEIPVLPGSAPGSQVVPIEGAYVTLQGPSGDPIFGTTNASGRAFFSNAPSGPYTATAQKDVSSIQGSSLLATTVVGANPGGRPKCIVLPLFFDALPVPSTDTVFEGTAVNVPSGAQIAYQVSARGLNAFIAGGQLAKDTFSLHVPSHIPFDATVYAIDATTGATLSAVILRDLEAEPDQALLKDFDFSGPNAHPFDTLTPVTYTNNAGLGQALVDLFMVGTGDFQFPMFFGSNLPSLIRLPDLSHPNLAGYSSFVAFNDAALDGAASTECHIAVGPTTPGSMTVNLLGTPAIITPADGAQLTTFGTGDTVSFLLGAGNGLEDGFNVVVIGDGFFESVWTIIMSPTATTLTVPPVHPSKPMFSSGFMIVGAGPARFDLSGFDFPTFFGSDLIQNGPDLSPLNGCTALDAHVVQVNQPLALPDPGSIGWPARTRGLQTWPRATLTRAPTRVVNSEE